MLWPAPSDTPSKAIETPVAWPVTTIWKASNSFCAAANEAEVGADASACTLGRIFCAAGATQTWAADAVPAVASSAAIRVMVFMTGLLGWLLCGSVGAFRYASPTQVACLFFPGLCAAPCADLGVHRAPWVLHPRATTRRAKARRFSYSTPNRPTDAFKLRVPLLRQIRASPFAKRAFEQA